MSEPDLTEKRADPIVDRYVTTDIPLLTLLQEAREPRSLLVEAMLQLHDCLEGRRLAKETVEMAQAVPLTDWNPELLVLFLSSWAELSCRIGRPSIAQALIHRARASFTETTHPEVVASIMLTESILADTTGNKSKCERILREIPTTVAEHSPRRRLYIWELALFLSLQGRGSETRNEIKQLTGQSDDRFKTSRLLIVQFTDAVETGRIQEASQFMSAMATSLHAPKDLARIPYRAYQDLLALMHLKVDSTLTPLPEIEQQRLKWVAVVHALLRHDTEGALRIARVEASRLLGSIFTSGFDSFNLIRAELAAGSGESALRLIKMRQSRGNHHYLDDLFAARAQRLMNNRSRAVEHFAAAFLSAEAYQAKGRLDFELRLACELGQGDIVDLTRAAEKRLQHRKSLASRPVATAVADALPAPPDAPPSPGIAAEDRDQAMRLGVNMIRGKSVALAELRDAVMRFADLEAPILITGETGTGKELVARALHLVSKRLNHPFTVVNCGAITETLLESELFGHERGAFTGAERANKGLFEATGEGTILLDEIGDITPRLQSSLLRVIETGEIRAVGSTKTRQISCRILAATNADLERMTEEGSFRRDLLYRLQRLGIHVPPLRERRDDILPLVRHYLDLGRRIGIHASMTDDLRAALRSYDWPGNIRELRNVVERMRLMHSDKVGYGLDDLDLRFQHVRERIKTEETLPAPNRPAPRAGGNVPPVADAAPPPPPPGAIPPKQFHRTLAQALPPARSADGSLNDAQVDMLVKKGRSPLRRLDRLRALFERYRKLTRKEAIDILGISPNTATKDLQLLCAEGFIRCVEPSQSTRSRYFERVAAPDTEQPPPPVPS